MSYILNASRPILIESIAAFTRWHVVVNMNQSNGIHAINRMSVCKKGVWLFFAPMLSEIRKRYYLSTLKVQCIGSQIFLDATLLKKLASFGTHQILFPQDKRDPKFKQV